MIPGEKQENKADFPCSQARNENEKNGVMGLSRPFAQKRTYSCFREELLTFDVVSRAKIKKAFTSKKKRTSICRQVDLNVLTQFLLDSIRKDRKVVLVGLK